MNLDKGSKDGNINLIQFHPAEVTTLLLQWRQEQELANLRKWLQLKCFMFVDVDKEKKEIKNRFYFLRLFSYMMKNSMARVKNLKNYLKQQYYVQAKQCILTGSAYQVKDM